MFHYYACKKDDIKKKQGTKINNIVEKEAMDQPQWIENSTTQSRLKYIQSCLSISHSTAFTK